jgi:hypothetical protein
VARVAAQLAGLLPEEAYEKCCKGALLKAEKHGMLFANKELPDKAFESVRETTLLKDLIPAY